MNVDEMKEEINRLGISPRVYSINAELGSDKCIFRQVHNYWECFYMDERGNQNNSYRRFMNESEACNYFINLLKLGL